MELENLLNLVLLQQLNELNERHQENVRRRQLRDRTNPFEMTEELFIKYFRLSKDTTLQLINSLRPHLQSQRSTAVPVELKVLTALSFFGYGSYQRCVGCSYNLALHQTTVSKIIGEVSDAIVTNLLPQSVIFPRTEEQRNLVKERFYQQFAIPGVIGAIDCTHIAIVAPATNDPLRPGIAYYNRKGFYSINVQMICDANLKILDCNARFPGSSHDSAIWSLSSIKRYLQQNYNEDEVRSTWLIAFGVLKQRFRCLIKHRTLHYHPLRAGKIIYSCVVLHNMALTQNVPLPDDDVEPDPDMHQNGNCENESMYGHVDVLAEGRRIRSELIRRYFQ
ncbi:hypothetical protein RN001_002206 [Aquatica leii]|uniref:DDE Tnp4 domain-containing protein n=1 Tax=Aquatica leii TaxID=1421715 RepID=A0AAN7QAZ3_9COLE|nr:hypothetical protein RN001_002206 [Aquatica leii]